VTINITPAGSTSTGDDGAYAFGGLLPGTYVITPEMAGCRFSPQSRTVVLIGDAPGNDFSAFCDGS
jgi:hypothetical protein